jgi:cellulose synthase/poly-beta-1,6-N-acetylglucosamine synthase-like glycosyltransferase
VRSHRLDAVDAGSESDAEHPQFLASVIIPARNEEQAIAGCIRALAEQTIGAKQIELIVVAAGDDRTADVAAGEAGERFGRLEIVRLSAGNKNVALRTGCARAAGRFAVLLDADTELLPDAVAELIAAVHDGPRAAAHGAMRARVRTPVSRYCELNRILVKELRFDGTLSGEVIVFPWRDLMREDLAALFPDEVGAGDDFTLSLALRSRGWRILYAPKARGSTLFPWTLGELTRSMLRNRRGVMAALSLDNAMGQAARSALLLAALPAALAAFTFSPVLSALCLAPLAVHVADLARKVATVRRRGLGDYRRTLPTAFALDLLGRSLKPLAFVERLAGRRAPVTFRGQRPAPR